MQRYRLVYSACEQQQQGETCRRIGWHACAHVQPLGIPPPNNTAATVLPTSHAVLSMSGCHSSSGGVPRALISVTMSRMLMPSLVFSCCVSCLMRRSAASTASSWCRNLKLSSSTLRHDGVQMGTAMG